MAEAQKSRRQMLEEFVAENPADAFARYGLALECTKLGEHETAVEHFRELLKCHPEYVVGYFQYGQLLAQISRKEEAREVLTRGMAAAQKAGDMHARDEMESLLRDLE